MHARVTLPKATVVNVHVRRLNQHGLTVHKPSDACDALAAADADAAAAIGGMHSLRARLAASSVVNAVRIVRAAIAAALVS